MRKHIYLPVLAIFLWAQPVFAQTEAPRPSENLPAVTTQFANDSFEKQMAAADIAAIDQMAKEGFDFNSKDSLGNPVLYYVLAQNADLNVARKVIEYGADVNAPAANGMIPLNIASSKANELQLQIMMMRTLGLDIANPEIQEELKKNLFLEMNRAIEMAQLLIESGADVNRQSSLGTPLMNAVTNAWNKEIIEMLIKAGADLNIKDKDGKTALFYAAASGNEDIATLLIKSGADTQIRNNKGELYLDVEKIDVGNPLADIPDNSKSEN